MNILGKSGKCTKIDVFPDSQSPDEIAERLLQISEADAEQEADVAVTRLGADGKLASYQDRRFNIFDFLTTRSCWRLDIYFYSKDAKIEDCFSCLIGKEPLPEKLPPIHACRTWKEVPIGAHSAFVKISDSPLWANRRAWVEHLPIDVFTHSKKRKKSQKADKHLKLCRVVLEYTDDEIESYQTVMSIETEEGEDSKLKEEEIESLEEVVDLQPPQPPQPPQVVTVGELSTDRLYIRAFWKDMYKKIGKALLRWSNTIRIQKSEMRRDETNKLLISIRQRKRCISTWRSRLPLRTQARHKWKSFSAGIFVQKATFDLRLCWSEMTPEMKEVVSGLAVVRWQASRVSLCFWTRLRKKLYARYKRQAREDARSTLANEMEAEKKARIREEAKKKAESATDKPFTARGRSGPTTRVTWAGSPAGMSEECKRQGKKKIDLEAIHMATEKKKEEKERIQKIERENARNVQIAHEMIYYA